MLLDGSTMRPAQYLPRPASAARGHPTRRRSRVAAAAAVNGQLADEPDDVAVLRQLEAVDQTVLVEVHHEVSRAWPHMNYRGAVPPGLGGWAASSSGSHAGSYGPQELLV